jgi:sugar/nucleoside kinase (ribokinase family)
MPEVLCVGIHVADVLARPVKEYPQRGRLVLVDKIELHTGGCAGNAAIGLARLGISTGVAGKIGADAFGDFYMSVMKKEGIDCRGLVRDSSVNTSATMVIVHPDGERSFIHYLGANAALEHSDIDFDLVREYRILHLAAAFVMSKLDGQPSARLLQRAKSEGRITALDTAWDSAGRWMSVIEPYFQHTDYFLPSIEEARMIAGVQEPADIARCFLDKGVKVVGLKMGEKGCYIRSSDAELRLPAYKVDVVDATGAGDAFAAGFLAGVAMGWDLERTGKLANAAGAFAVTAIGTTAGLKGLDETVHLMETAPTLPLYD